MVLTRTVAGREFELDKERIEQAVANVLPDPLRDHYVVVDGRRFPPKQVLACVTGRADFTTQQARRILQRVGFLVGRVAQRSEEASAELHFPQQGAEAAALRAFRGCPVAITTTWMPAGEGFHHEPLWTLGRRGRGVGP